MSNINPGTGRGRTVLANSNNNIVRPVEHISSVVMSDIINKEQLKGRASGGIKQSNNNIISGITDIAMAVMPSRAITKPV